MKNKTWKIIAICAAVIAAALLARYVVFKQQFDDVGVELQRVENWQEKYKQEHPDATKAEMDAAFFFADPSFEAPTPRLRQKGRIGNLQDVMVAAK